MITCMDIRKEDVLLESGENMGPCDGGIYNVLPGSFQIPPGTQ